MIMPTSETENSTSEKRWAARHRGALLVGGTFAVAIVVLLLGRLGNGEVGTVPPLALEVRTARVALRPVPNTTDVSGFLRPHRTVQLAMEESGRVFEKPFEAGAEVAAGDLLVALDADHIGAEVARAEADLAQAESALVLAADRMDRAHALAAERAISDDEFQSTETAHQVAAATVGSRRAARDMMAVRFDRHRLAAPMDGTLSEIDVEVGSHLMAGVVLGRLDDVSALEVDLAVAPEVRSVLGVGDTVALWPDTDPEAIHAGVIARLADVADAISRKFDVEVRVDNAARTLLAGAAVRCRLTVGEPRQALVIPEEWTIAASGGTQVFRVIHTADGASVEQIHIETARLREAPGRIEVTAALAPGDEIATERLPELTHGQAISPELIADVGE